MQATSTGYHAVLQAIAVSQNTQSSQADRIAALQTLDQVKRGEIHASTEVCVALLNTPAIEAQLSGFQLLTFLATHRWQDFTDQEHRQLLDIALAQLQRIATSADAWPLKSRSTMLLATLLKRQGAAALQGVLTQLLGFAQGGVVHTELVCMVLQSVAEEVTQYYDDLDMEAKRQLLSTLTASLPVVLPFLTATLESQYQVASVAGQDDVKAHRSCIAAALGTATAYCEWCPLGHVSDAGLLRAAAFLINTPDFREPALELLRQVGERKQAQEEATTYRAAMQHTGTALMAAAAAVLGPEQAGELDVDGVLDEYGRRLCDTMALFGIAHFRDGMQSPEARITFLQQMLAFARHPYLLLSAAALPFWVDLLRGLADRNAKKEQRDGQGGSDGSVPPDCVAALLDLAGQQIVKGVHLVEDDLKDGDIPPYFDGFQDYKDFCVAYRGKLAQIARATAQLLPAQAMDAAARRLSVVLPMCAAGSGADAMQQRTQLEAAVVFLEAVVTAVADAHLGAAAARNPANAQAATAGLESLLQMILAAVIVEPYLLFFHAKGLEPFGKLLAVRPNYALQLIHKVFEMFEAAPLGAEAIPPPKTTVQWKDGFHARQRIASVLLSNAKVAPAAFVPHLELLAGRVQQAVAAHQLRLGERNVMAEALLAAASGTDDTVMAQVLEWVLSGVRTDWTSAAFLSSLANPAAFISIFLLAQPDGQGGVEVGGREARWTIYHEVHQIFRVLQRLTVDMQGSPPSPTPSTPSAGRPPPAPSQLLGTHAAWVLPPLLQLTACLHGVYQPGPRAQLAPLEGLFAMPPAERAVYLRQSNTAAKLLEDEGGDTLASTSVASCRQWLRTLRETLYQVLGIVPLGTPGFYQNQALCAAWPVALLADVQHMDAQHLRILLRHVLIPFLRGVPPSARDTWALPVLRVLLPHLHARLSEAWAAQCAAAAGLPGEEASHAPQQGPVADDSAMADEIIKSRLLVELTKEAVVLLGLLHEKAGDTTAGSETMLSWLLRADIDTCFAAVALATAALGWKEAAQTTCTLFCRQVVMLASKDATLASYVGSDMLSMAIRALSQSMSPTTTELLQLIREILAQQLGKAQGPTQVLLSLPGVNEMTLSQLSASFKQTGSEKEQRNMLKTFFLQAGGPMFSQLAQWGMKPKAIKIAQPVAKVRGQGGGEADFGVTHMFNLLMDNNVVH